LGENGEAGGGTCTNREHKRLGGKELLVSRKGTDPNRNKKRSGRLESKGGKTPAMASNQKTDLRVHLKGKDSIRARVRIKEEFYFRKREKINTTTGFDQHHQVYGQV